MSKLAEILFCNQQEGKRNGTWHAMRDNFNDEEKTVLQEKSCYVDRRAKEDVMAMYSTFFPIFQYAEEQVTSYSIPQSNSQDYLKD